jgi:HK97 family phage portal protein
MSWLAKLGGFDSKNKGTDTTQMQQKNMMGEIDPNNAYWQRMFQAMMYNGYDINNYKDTTSIVQDGYTNVSIYSIINYIITTAANVKFKVQIMDGDTWEDDPGSELLKLLRRPNAITPYSLFIEETLGWKFLDGAYYIYGPRLEFGPNGGKTTELWTMPSTKMQIKGGGIRKPILGYSYQDWEGMIPAEDVLYGRYFNPVDAVDNISASMSGFAPLRSAIMTARKSNSAAMAGVKAYENNGAMGIISSAGQQWAEFNQDLAEQLGEKLKRENGGANNFNKMAVIPGAVKFDRTNMSPADLRLGESELQTMRQLAGVFKFPTQLLNDADGATFSNQREAQKSIYTNTIIPELAGLGEGLATWLGDAYYPNNEIRIIPDTNSIEVLQEDKQAQAAWLKDADWMTQNEKRTEMGLDEDPDERMNDYLIPTGKMFAEDMDMLNEINGQQRQLSE